MKVSGAKKRIHTIPAIAASAMQLNIRCEKCDSRFAVIGSAYFCPACGHNSVIQTFADSLRKIRAKIENIEVVRNSLNRLASLDEAELTCRSLSETCISDGVVAVMSHFLIPEHLELKYPGKRPPKIGGLLLRKAIERL